MTTTTPTDRRACPVCGQLGIPKRNTYCSKSCATTARGARHRGVKCGVPDCTSPVRCNGYCDKHNQRHRKHGDPRVTLMPRRDMSDAEKFWSRVAMAAPDECWEWGGERNRHGYGWFTTYRNGGRNRQYAHRRALELMGECLVPGLVVMHSCDNPPCVNPAHLTQGTQKENLQDALKKGRLDMSGLALAPNNLKRARRAGARLK